MKKITINELQDCFRTDQKTLWSNFTQNLTSNQKMIIKNSLSDETDPDRFNNRDLNERRAYEHLSAKYSHLDSSFEEYNPAMGQTMNNRFEKESIHSHQAKFSSSVGFRDAKPQFRDKSQGRRGYNLRSPASNAEKVEEGSHGYNDIIKTLFSNYHKISAKATEKLDITQDLIYQNEEHLVDLVENTDRFLKDIQDTGFQPGFPVYDDKADLVHSQRNETKKIIHELDGMIEQYGDYPDRNRFLTPNQPYRTFNSEKANRRGTGIAKQLNMEKESTLITKINSLHQQLQSKETETAQRYESTIKQLEKKLKSELRASKESQTKYTSLADASSDFQIALKDLQKAVRGKKYNISSYKKIFEQKSKDLTAQLHDHRSKVASRTCNKDFYATYNTMFSSRGATPEKSNPRVNSEQRINPKNLTKVFYGNEATDKDEEVEKLRNKVVKLTKQIDTLRQKAKEVGKERNILQELCMEKDVMLKEKINTRNKDSNQEDSFSDGESSLIQAYKIRLNKAEEEAATLKTEIKILKSSTKEITLISEANSNTYKAKLKDAKSITEEMVEDTQKLLEGKVRAIAARLSEKEKRLERVIKEVRERLEMVESGESKEANESYEQEIVVLKEKYDREIKQLKEREQERCELEDQLEDMQENEKEIDSLKGTLQKKNKVIERIKGEILEKNGEVSEISDKLIEEQRLRSKEMKDLKLELSEALKLADEKQQLEVKLESLKEQIKDIRARSAKELSEISQEKDELITELQSEVSSLKKDLRKETQSQKVKEDQIADKLRAELEEEFSKIEEDLKQKLKTQKEEDSTHQSQIEQLTYENESYDSKLQDAERKYKLKLSDLEKKLEQKSSDYDELCETLETQREESTQNSSQREKLLENDLEKIKADLKTVTESYKQREKEFDQRLKEIQQEMSDSISEIKSENADLSSQLRTKGDELLDLTTKISEKDHEITKLQRKLEEEKKKLSDVFTQKQSEELDVVKNTHQKQISELMQKLADASAEREELRQENNKLEAETKEFKPKCIKIQKQLDKLINENEQISHTLEDAQDEIIQYQEKCSTDLETIKTLRKEIKEANKKNTQLQEQSVLTAEEADNLRNEVSLLSSKINTLKTTLQTSQEQNDLNNNIEEEKDNLNSKYLRLEKEHKRLKSTSDKTELENTHHKRQIQDQETENIQLKGDLDNMRERITKFDENKQVNDSLKDAIDDLKKKEEQLDQLRKDFEEERQQFSASIKTLKNETKSKTEKIEELTDEINDLNESLIKEKKVLTSKATKLQKQLKEANDELSNANQDQTGAQSKYTSLKAEHNSLKQRCEEQSTLLGESQDKNLDLETKLKAFETSMAKKNAEIDTKKLEIKNLESKISSLKSDIEEYEETNNSLSDSLTKCKVESGELEYKITRLEESNKALEDSRDQDDSTEQISTMVLRINSLEDENKNLRMTINDLNEKQSKLETEIGQYKLNLERIKKEQTRENELQETEKNNLLSEANDLLEQFNAEKH